MKTIRLRTSKKALYSELKKIPRELTGRRTETELNKVFLNHLAHDLFTKIQETFEDKSDGGTDEFGKKWQPLLPETIAQRPITNEEYRRAAVRQGERGILTAQQNRIWKGIFRSTRERLIKQGLTEAKAEIEAATTAWAIIKKQGGKTKLKTFGRRKVKLLRVSDRLYDSLSPGTMSGNRYYPPQEQVFRIEDGNLTIGTDVPYAGTLSKRRPVVPPATDVARGGWLKDSIKRSKKALVGVLTDLLQSKFR